MSEAQQSIADKFYSPESATTETDTAPSGTAVEAEAVEVEKSANDEAVEVTKEIEASEVAEADAVESESGEQEESGADDDEPLYFQMGDKEISVADVQEGLDSGLRRADYTKKTQALADDRKTFEADQVKVGELSKSLTEHIEALEHSFKKEEAEVDWEHLREYDTGEYLKQKEIQQNKVDSLDAAKAEVKKLDDEKNIAFITAEQQKLVDAFPEWKDPATGTEAREKDSKLIEAYVTDNGFSNDEFKNLTSSNVMIAIHKAAQFDALKKDSDAAEKIVRKAPKAIKPGPKRKQTKSKSAVDVMYPNG